MPGWYPCCCDVTLTPVTPPVFVECTSCRDDNAPPFVCLSVSGFTNIAVPVHGCCPENLNGNWPLAIELGLPFPDTPSIDIPFNTLCLWHCKIDPIEIDTCGVSAPPPFTPAWGITDVMFSVGTTTGGIYVLVASIKGTAGEVSAYVNTGSTTKPDCTTWSNLLLVSAGLNTLTTCDGTFAVFTVTSKNEAIPSRVEECCFTGSDAGTFTHTCHRAKIPPQLKVVLSGIENCEAADCFTPAAGDCVDCADLNGTYFLDLTSNLAGGCVDGGCCWGLDIPEVCGVEYLDFDYQGLGSPVGDLHFCAAPGGPCLNNIGPAPIPWTTGPLINTLGDCIGQVDTAYTLSQCSRTLECWMIDGLGGSRCGSSLTGIDMKVTGVVPADWECD